MNDPRALERFAILLSTIRDLLPGRILTLRVNIVEGSPVVTPIWASTPTANELSTFNTFIINYDWRFRTKRNIANVVNQVEALSAGAKQALSNRVLAEYLIDHPRVAEIAGITVEEPSS